MKVFGWMLLVLIGIDLVVGVGFLERDRMPRARNLLGQYAFENESIESKLRQQARFAQSPDDALRAGWVDDVYGKKTVFPNNREDALVTAVYGSSFSNQLGEALASTDERLAVRLISGPSAPPSHSYYTMTHDPEADSTDVVVLGILLSTLPKLITINDGVQAFRFPRAYLFPRYIIQGDSLHVIEPVVRSYVRFEEALDSPTLWNQYRAQLERYDAFFDTFLFDSTPTDYSFTIGLVRKAWARRQRKTVPDRWGQDPSSEVATTAFAILSDFHRLASARNQRAMVVLFNAQQDDDAEALLVGYLSSQGIAYVTSSASCSASDPGHFEHGHFTDHCNALIAQDVSRKLHGSSF